MNTPALARIVNALAPTDVANAFGRPSFDPIRQRIPGWSQPFHYTFFHIALSALPDFASVLVCGVYRGLDLALMAEAARRLSRPINLTGVDLFADAPCADWSPEQRARGTWTNVGIGLPPDIEAARTAAPSATIVQSNSIEYLADHAHEFDLIYLDTSHDESTVRAEIAAITRSRERQRVDVCPPSSALRPLLLAGDDYSEPGTHWGVDKAVCALLPQHVVFYNRIWLAQL